MIGEIYHVLMSADDVILGFESGAQPYLGSVRDDLYRVTGSSPKITLRLSLRIISILTRELT